MYTNQQTNPPTIPRNILENLLRICVTEAPFKNINGDIYVQKEGLAMGGPLSCTLANFYMCHVENNVLESLNIKPSIYARFVDDIFLEVRDENHLLEIKQKFHEESRLNYTHELSVNKKLPYLDVLIDGNNNDKYIQKVFTKPTKSDDCLNYDGDAPERYKTGVIKTLLHRAHKICNTEEGFNEECSRIKRLLVNNNFPNSLCDKIIKIFKEKKLNAMNPGSNTGSLEISINSTDNQGVSQSNISGRESNSDRITDSKNCVDIFYMNQYSKNYKVDEKVLRNIMKSHVWEINVKIKLVIYYKSKKTSDLIIRNNFTKGITPNHQKSHLVYQYVCNLGECKSLNNTYIGLTNCTLEDRLKQHRYKGSIFSHLVTVHGCRPEIDNLLRSTKILYMCDDRRKLPIYEALHIRKLKPTLNENLNNFECLSLDIF